MDYQKNIITSGKTIYDTETTSNMALYIPVDVLEAMLNDGLIGLSLTGLPLRTRSKFVKSLICKALGWLPCTGCVPKNKTGLSRAKS